MRRDSVIREVLARSASSHPVCASCPDRPRTRLLFVEPALDASTDQLAVFECPVHGKAMVRIEFPDDCFVDNGDAFRRAIESLPSALFLKNWAKCELVREKREVRIS